MKARLPQLESLRYLETCVRLGNFSEAARELGISPAAVSLRIRNLEADMGVRLFIRHGPRVVATPAAERMAGAVAKALKLMGAAVSEASADAARLRVTCVPSLGARWLAPRLRRYHQRDDAVPIDLDITPVVRSPDDFDVAIRSGPGNWPGYDADLLLPIASTPMLSPALAAAIDKPADLATLPLLAHPGWPEWFERAGAGALELTYYPDEYATHDLDATAAVEGVGVALLSRVIFSPLVDEGKLVCPFATEIPEAAAHYVLRHPGEDRPAVAGFVDWLISEARGPAIHRQPDQIFAATASISTQKPGSASIETTSTVEAGRASPRIESRATR